MKPSEEIRDCYTSNYLHASPAVADDVRRVVDKLSERIDQLEQLLEDCRVIKTKETLGFRKVDWQPEESRREEPKKLAEILRKRSLEFAHGGWDESLL